MSKVLVSEKYSVLLKKESSAGISNGLQGALVLTEDQLVFDPNSSFLTAFNNGIAWHPGANATVIPVNKIKRVEIGSFKHLFVRTIYTLRVYDTDGSLTVFMMTSQANSAQWLEQINKLL